MRPRIVVVVGMNRSGTSLVCQALSRLGVSFGEPLMPADEGNPRGYYEHRDIVEAQTLLLQTCRDRRGWNDIGELKHLPSMANEEARLRERLCRLIEANAKQHWMFGVKTTYWPRMPGVWSMATWRVAPIFVHAMRTPSYVLQSIVRAAKTEDRLTVERERQFYRQWAWTNAELFGREPRCELWYEAWWPDASQNMEKLARFIGKEPVSTEGLLL